MVRKLALNDEGEIANRADERLVANFPFGGNTFGGFARTAPSLTARDAGLAAAGLRQTVASMKPPAAETAGLGKNPRHGVGAAEVARRIMAAVRRG
jgi:hypothetical protein